MKERTSLRKVITVKMPDDEEDVQLIRFQSFVWTRQEQIDNAFLDDTLQEIKPSIEPGEGPTQKARKEKDEGA